MNKKGVALNEVFGAVLTLVLVAILFIIAIFLFVSLGESFNSESSELISSSNVSNELFTEFSNYTSLIGIIGTVIFLGLVIGILVASFAFGGRNGSLADDCEESEDEEDVEEEDEDDTDYCSNCEDHLYEREMIECKECEEMFCYKCMSNQDHKLCKSCYKELHPKKKEEIKKIKVEKEKVEPIYKEKNAFESRSKFD